MLLIKGAEVYAPEYLGKKELELQMKQIVNREIMDRGGSSGI